MEIYKKLQQARLFIKNSDIKKSGRNEFSKYDYFTPEQINHLVHLAEVDAGIIHTFDMIRTELGYHGYLNIIDIDSGEILTFTQATDIPSITATNITQQIGGAVTYTNRYLLMTAFDIVDNNLDPDSKDNSKQTNKVQPRQQIRVEKPQAKVEPNKLEHIPQDLWTKTVQNINNEPSKVKCNEWVRNTLKKFTLTDDEQNILAQIIDNKM